MPLHPGEEVLFAQIIEEPGLYGDGLVFQVGQVPGLIHPGALGVDPVGQQEGTVHAGLGGPAVIVRLRQVLNAQGDVVMVDRPGPAMVFVGLRRRVVLQPAGAGIAENQGHHARHAAHGQGDDDAVGDGNVCPAGGFQALHGVLGTIRQQNHQTHEEEHPRHQQEHAPGTPIGGQQPQDDDAGPHHHQDIQPPHAPQVRQGGACLRRCPGFPQPAVVSGQLRDDEHVQRQPVQNGGEAGGAGQGVHGVRPDLIALKKDLEQGQGQQRPITADKAPFHAPPDVGQLHRRVCLNGDGGFLLGVKNLYLGGLCRQVPASGGAVVPVGLQPLRGLWVKLGGGEKDEGEPQLLRLRPAVAPAPPADIFQHPALGGHV